MKIGLLSDTHGHLDKRIFTFFETCDEIWHAGDIGSLEVVNALAAFKPLKAVHGNIDGQAVRATYPQDLFFSSGGAQILLTHISGKPPFYHPRVAELIKEKKPQLLVCGHTHILRVFRQTNLLYVNPGACGYIGIHTVRTLLRFELQKGKVSNMEVIELWPRYITEN